jgi:hypothetical protein
LPDRVFQIAECHDDGGTKTPDSKFRRTPKFHAIAIQVNLQQNGQLKEPNLMLLPVQRNF